MFKLSNFLLCLGVIMLLSNLSFSQVDQLKSYLEPYNSQGFSYWNYDSSLSNVTYKVEIVELMDDPDSLSLTPGSDISQYNTSLKATYISERSYFRMPEEYTDGDYFYKLSVVSENGDVLEEEDYKPLCPSCTYNFVCNAKCVGPDYAWVVNIYQNANGASYGYLQGMSNQFMYMGQTAWDNWSQGKDLGNYPNAGLVNDDNDEGGCYRNQSGATITSQNVYQVPIGLGDWSSIGGDRTLNVTGLSVVDACNSYTSNDNRVSFLIDRYNTYTGITPDLKCEDAPEPCGDIETDTTLWGDDDYPDSLAVKFWSENHVFDSIPLGVGGDWNPDDNDDPIESIDEVLSSLDVLIDGKDRPGGDYSDDSYVSDIRNFIIHPIVLDKDVSQEDILLGKSEVYGEGYSANPVNVDLANGFYRLTVNFIDNSSKNVYFIFNDDVSQNDDASETEVTIYPNPITNQSISINLVNENYEGVSFDYDLLDLSGNVLDSKKNVSLTSNDYTFSSSFSSGISNSMIVAKFTFSDNSTKEVSLWVQ